MSNRTSKILVIVSAVVLLLSGAGLYVLFDIQGYGKTERKQVVSYNIKDYIETRALAFNDYNNVYNSINVSRVDIKNISNDSISDFISREDELIGYIDAYYDEIVARDGYVPINTANSNIKVQINGTILSVFYELDFFLDDSIFENNVKKYVATINIDLATEEVLSNDFLLKKYDYTKRYLSEKLFEEDVLIATNQAVMQKDTNITLTKSDIEKQKEEYVERIVNEFDNIIKMYIENNSLVMVYDKKELNNIFFDNNYMTELKIRYLK